jgi:hypothetical protein
MLMMIAGGLPLDPMTAIVSILVVVSFAVMVLLS